MKPRFLSWWDASCSTNSERKKTGYGTVPRRWSRGPEADPPPDGTNKEQSRVFAQNNLKITIKTNKNTLKYDPDVIKPET